MIHITSTGSFNNTEKFLAKLNKNEIFRVLDRYGRVGAEALSRATPLGSGETAASWSYEVVQEAGSYSIHWTNSHINAGVNIAVIIQYGHGTGTGGYVAGRDYINPAIRPVFDQILNDVWKEVTSA